MADQIEKEARLNLFHTIMSLSLAAAQEIHASMCLFDADHAAQANLNRAMHSVLIAAEQCRQAHARKGHPNG